MLSLYQMTPTEMRELKQQIIDMSSDQFDAWLQENCPEITRICYGIDAKHELPNVLELEAEFRELEKPLPQPPWTLNTKSNY